MSWRIDSKAKSKKEAELNELTTIVELVLGNKTADKKDSQVRCTDQLLALHSIKVIRFEMDKEQLDKAMLEINAIQKQLSKFSS